MSENVSVNFTPTRSNCKRDRDQLSKSPSPIAKKANSEAETRKDGRNMPPKPAMAIGDIDRDKALTSLTFGELIDALLTSLTTTFATKAEVQQVSDSITHIEEKCTSNSYEIKALKDKVNDLEDRGRRNNLIFSGLQVPQPGQGDCAQVISTFIKDTLKIQQEVYINRSHPLGKPQKGRIIAHIPNDSDVNMILRNCNKLKEHPNINITRDCSYQTRYKRNFLLALRRVILDINPNKKLSVIRDFALLGNQRFDLDEENNIIFEDQDGLNKLSELIGAEENVLRTKFLALKANWTKQA